jgi:hypothetical protein
MITPINSGGRMPLHFEDLDSETSAVVESFLPATAKELVRLIGLEKTLALCSAYGGTEISFPRQKNGPGAANYARLEKVIGGGNLHRLSTEYLQEIVYIPRCLRAMTALRHREIIIDYEALLRTTSARQAANQLAIRFRTTSRSIEKIVNGEPRKGHGRQSTEDNR